MDSRRASFEAGSSSADSQEPRSPSFVPCRSPSNDNTQPQFVGQRAETLLTVRSQQPMFQIPVSVPPVPVVPMVPNLPGVEDGADGVGGQRSRTRNSAAFNWDHQAILFLIDAKRREWEDFELKH
ncbi:hypothetical protein R1sor_024954 [Riccia sorocarpa]|uniref:Uncharacterized protein n=1 Tax=Riccia sorocarpa TaxID=122646 RepID=A0ABD3G8I9_9MARC